VIAGRALFLPGQYGVAISGGSGKRQISAIAPRLLNQLFEQILCAFRAFMTNDRIKRIQPFLRFLRINVRNFLHFHSSTFVGLSVSGG
jgi:hypothetical protein